MFSTGKALFLLYLLFSILPAKRSQAAQGEFESSSAKFFATYCISCHGEDKQKGNVTLHDIPLDFSSPEQSFRWIKLLGQLETGEMPPDDEDQPSHEIRAGLIAGIYDQFRLAGNPVEQLRTSPTYGNYINHEELFSGIHKGPAYSRPRIWRISPYIDGQSSPFSLSQEEGFKDYAYMWSMDKPTIELLIMNADAAVKQQIGPSEAELERQDDLWKKRVLQQRRALRIDIETEKTKLANDTRNASLQKKLDNLLKQLEKNEATDFEKDRKRPSAKLDGLKKNVFWRSAYGESMPPEKDLYEAALRQLNTALRRRPSEEDVQHMADRFRESIARYGNETGTQLVMTSILLLPESIYRMELGFGEKLPDGRRRLNSAETAYALGYALTDGGPDKLLLEDMNADKLSEAEAVRVHAERIYHSAITSTEKRKGKAERVLRFFQEYFGYTSVTDVFKDGSRHPGHNPRPSDLLKDTDMLIMHILKEDKDVLHELLTTELNYIRYVPTRPGWETLGSYNVTRQQAKENNLISGEKNKNGQRYVMELTGQRAGILTQPSWLTAHSTNFDNDPVKRGKWIYEHLLGGIIPDLPITVDATVPEDPDKSLRERFEKTQKPYCMRCHAKMNPLGMTFELYDDVGRYRAKELLRDNKTEVPVNASGGIAKSGVPGLDGPVNGALELMDKLAASDHVRQVFVRHAFRYWMGRNETLEDSPTLIAADKAYVESGGSMKALVASLLSSDSFLYRKDLEQTLD